METSLGSVRLTGPYVLKRIESLFILSEPNEHGFAKISGIIEEAEEESVISAEASEIRISELNGGKETLLFCGITTGVKSFHRGGVRRIEIEAHSGSIQMDVKRKRRSFQDKAGSYKEILNCVIKDGYKGDYTNER